GIGAHEHGEIVLHLAFAREAPPDAHALAWRRRIDIEPGLGHELCDRIDVRHVDPVGAAIIRHPECLGVGDASTAHFRGRLDDRDPPAGRDQASRRRNAGGAGADDDRIGVALRPRLPRAGLRERRCGGHGGGCGAKRAAADALYGWQEGFGKRTPALGGRENICSNGSAPRTRPPGFLPRLAGPSGLPDQPFSRMMGAGGQPMLEAAFKALAQMFSRPFRGVLWKSIGLALILIVVVGIGLHRLLVWLVTAGESWLEQTFGFTTNMPVAILVWILSFAT